VNANQRMRARFWFTALLLGSACRDSKAVAPAPLVDPDGGTAVAPSADDDPSPPTIDILTYQYNLARTGVTSLETILTPANVTAGSFGKKASFAVDGFVYAGPLYVSNLALPSGQREVLFVATEHDSVYAFDATAATTDPLWHVSLLATGELPVPSEDTGSDDLVPEIGITGTPVIDRAAELLYVVSKAKRTDGSYVQRLHALRLADGSEGPGSPVVIAAQVPGTAPDAVDGKVSFEALRHNQRAALALIGGRVVIAWASHGDNGLYHGWLMAYDTAALGNPPAAFLTTPDGLAGGIWMGANGPSADADGNIYVASGNGDFDTDKDDGARTNFGLSALKLHLDGNVFTVKDFFSPHETDELNSADLDFGTSAAVLLPDRAGTTGHRLVVGGKTGSLYVLDRDDLGHFNNDTDRVVQTLIIDSSFLISNPVIFGDSLYILPHKLPLMAFTIDPATGLFGDDPTSVANTCLECFNRGSTPSVSANGTKNAIVWALDNSGYKTIEPAILHAYDATDLTNELYASPSSKLDANAAGLAVKFTVPAVANGRVFVGGQKAVTVYGLLK
jgi:hypothetical protein